MIKIKTLLQSLNYNYLFIPAAVLFIFISINISKEFDKGTDFNVFYQAGVNFSNKVSLYTRIGGAERYIYPPFAAMVFQPFHLFAMPISGGVWIFINWVLFAATIYLIRRLLLQFNVEKKSITIALTLGTIFSFRYVWYHALYAQMNLLVLFLSLLSISLFLKGKQWGVVVCLAIAISIKVLPIVVLFWLISKSNYKLILKAIIALMICTLLPIIFRGNNMWWNDLKEYYATFLLPFQQGKVEPDYQNYSLSAAIYKILMPTVVGGNNPRGFEYNLLNISPELAQSIYKTCAAIFFVIFTTVVVYTRFFAKKIFLYEISFILLFTHLISGITWEYHLVSLLLVQILFFLTVKKTNTLSTKIFHYLVTAFMFLNAIIGLDTVGIKFYYFSCGYSFLTLLLLLLFVHSTINIFSKNSPSIQIATI